MHIEFQLSSVVNLSQTKGPVIVCVNTDKQLSATAEKIDRTGNQADGTGNGGQITRVLNASRSKSKLKGGTVLSIPAPVALKADELIVLVVDADLTDKQARKAGSALAKALKGRSATFVLDNLDSQTDFVLELAMAVQLKSYRFDMYKTQRTEDEEDKPDPDATLTFVSADPHTLNEKFQVTDAIVQGVHFTRTLTNEPANILNVQEFSRRLEELTDLGIQVTVMHQDELERLGFRALLAVGQGSVQDSRVVVMHWRGEGVPEDSRPLALVGKGVVFDSGGISIKPAAGMESMTMDMGGAGVVAGVMKTLALRKAKTNIVALVGLVENMPDANAQRPGDIVKSLKGTTIEVINTDAEGRMVLADVLTYTQQKFNPKVIINLATLTGAMIIGLGHHRAGYFANNDQLAQAFQKSCDSVDEGAWRMPLDDAYGKLIKSRFADIKNTGGRAAGSITAAMFLKHFIENDTPWMHIDIAGVALPPEETELSPKGASGWGVRALNRFIKSHAEF